MSLQTRRLMLAERATAAALGQLLACVDLGCGEAGPSWDALSAGLESLVPCALAREHRFWNHEGFDCLQLVDWARLGDAELACAGAALLAGDRLWVPFAASLKLGPGEAELSDYAFSVGEFVSGTGRLDGVEYQDVSMIERRIRSVPRRGPVAWAFTTCKHEGGA